MEQQLIRDREHWVSILDEAITRNGASPTVLYDRALALEDLARQADAIATYETLIELDPDHVAARTKLARLYVEQKRLVEAFHAYLEVVRRQPDSAAAYSNLARMLFLGGDGDAALAHYRHALMLDPRLATAHRGIAAVLQARHEPAEAARHLELAAQRSPFMYEQYRGADPPISLLLLVTATADRRSTFFERLIDDRTFAMTKICIEDTAGVCVPENIQLIVNGVGEPERCRPALELAQRFLAQTGLPVINPPGVIGASGREETASRVQGIAGLRVPRIALYRAGDTTRHAIPSEFSFPFLLRAIGYHCGMHFSKIHTSDELARALALHETDDIFVIEYIDVTNSRGAAQKYRVVAVDKVLYPVHLAISSSWKVHYFSSDMAHDAEYRALEREFLDDMHSHLGPAVVDVLREIVGRMGLDYGGIDFARDRDGHVVLFEANAMMDVIFPGPEPIWSYRHAAAQRVKDAVNAMLRQRVDNGSSVTSDDRVRGSSDMSYALR